MSTVLIYTSPARGHLYPMMDVGLALRAGGHDVVVATLSDERATVESAGLTHRPIAADVESVVLDDHRAQGAKAQFEAALNCWGTRAEREVPDLERAFDDVQPDIAVIDANSWGASAVAQSRGAPWAMFMPYCLPVPSHDAPAFGPGFAPPRHFLDRARDRLVWGALKRMAAPSIGRLNALRAELGVPELAGLPDLYLQPDAVLYRTAEPFEYSREDWPDNVHMLGPGLWSPPTSTPTWLSELPRPRVLVSVSTEFQEDGAIIDAALEALADEPGSIIVTTSSLDPTSFAPPHDRTRIERFLSHAAVIDDIDLVVTHGGMGTTQRALAAGVPLVVVPWGRDQRESARRVDVSGAGVQLSPKRLNADSMRTAIRTALTRTDAAANVARGFAQAGGADEAVRILETLSRDATASHR